VGAKYKLYTKLAGYHCNEPGPTGILCYTSVFITSFIMLLTRLEKVPSHYLFVAATGRDKGADWSTQ